jgi:hypothetical protein
VETPIVIMAEYDGVRQEIRGCSDPQHGLLSPDTEGEEWYWKYGELLVSPCDITRWRCKDCFLYVRVPIQFSW